MKRIAIIGAGGHGKVIIDMIRANHIYKVVAVFDDKYKTLNQKLGVYYGPIVSLNLIKEISDCKFVIAIGNNAVRQKIVKQLGLKREQYGTIIHPTATISESVTIGFGTVIMPNAVINADTIIGDHVIINTAAVVEHDNSIGNFVHISPNATLTGTVLINEGTQIGAGATIIPSKQIGKWCIIGAGSVVIQDIPSLCKAVGSPARIIK
ncbi:acetyltransferase [Bacillus cereus]|nr:acetyltransferase [Bacillus cereus]